MLNSEPGPLGSSQNEEKNPFPGWGGEDQAADHAHPPPTAHVTTLRGSSLELSIGQHHSPTHPPNSRAIPQTRPGTGNNATFVPCLLDTLDTLYILSSSPQDSPSVWHYHQDPYFIDEETETQGIM